MEFFCEVCRKGNVTQAFCLHPWNIPGNEGQISVDVTWPKCTDDRSAGYRKFNVGKTRYNYSSIHAEPSGILFPDAMPFSLGHVGGVGFDTFFPDLADAGGAVGTENESECDKI